MSVPQEHTSAVMMLLATTLKEATTVRVKKVIMAMEKIVNQVRTFMAYFGFKYHFKELQE